VVAHPLRANIQSFCNFLNIEQIGRMREIRNLLEAGRHRDTFYAEAQTMPAIPAYAPRRVASIYNR
jgi:hypothetical protein